MSKGKLYLFAALASAAGILWVLLNREAPGGAHVLSPCLFRNVTGIPCPSCGSTHAVEKLLKLDWRGAFYDNPLGYVIALSLIVVPAWLLYDVLSRKSSFYRFYSQCEKVIRKPWVAATLIVLITANWIWNICKYNV